MRGFKASFLLVAVISLLSLSQPAQAQQIVHDPTSLAKMLADAAQNVLKMLSGITNIFGTTGTTLPDTIGTIDGKPVIAEPCPYTSLVGYLKCDDKKKAQREAFVQTVNAQERSALQVDNKRTADATLQLQHKQKVTEMQVNAYNDALGRDAAFCNRPSLERSTIAQIFIARMMMEERMAKAAKKLDGDVSDPTTSRGQLQYSIDTVKKRIDAGVLSCTGNDGANDKLCGGSGSGSADLANVDQMSTTLTSPWLLTTQDKKKFSAKYADMYIDNLVGGTLSPLSKDQLDNLTGQAAEVLNDRASYSATMSQFLEPYYEALSDREGTEGLTAFESLDAVLARANITGELKDRLIENGKTSKAGSRFIRYKVYNHDPKGTTDEVGIAALNTGNLMALSLQREMDQVTLLYDINETLEQTNLLLGAIGIELARGRKAAIESKTSQIAASPPNK